MKTRKQNPIVKVYSIMRRMKPAVINEQNHIEAIIPIDHSKDSKKKYYKFSRKEMKNYSNHNYPRDNRSLIILSKYREDTTSCHLENRHDSKKIYDELMRLGFEIIDESYIKDGMYNFCVIKDKVIIKTGQGIIESKQFIVTTIASNTQKMHEYARLISKYEQPMKEYKIDIVVQRGLDLEVETHPLKDIEVDVGLNYGSKFLTTHEIILDSLNLEKSGIVLLHGEPGTGKTTYIKYLGSRLEKKKMVYLPSGIAQNMDSPQLIGLLDQCRNGVFIIEDGEHMINTASHNGGRPQGLAALLNASDGLLGDLFNIQFIITFNCDDKKIDPALRRKGRMLAEHEFGRLSIDESNKLLKHLGINRKAIAPMNLSDIYNTELPQPTSDLNKKNVVGFG